MLSVRHSVVSGAAFVALSLAIWSEGLAQEQSPPVEPRKEASGTDDRVRELMKAGNEAFRLGDFAAAERAYREAHARGARFDTAGALGQVLLQLGKFAEAAKYLQESLSGMPSTISPEVRTRAAELLGRAITEAGRLVLSVNVDGADVFLDGKPIGRSPITEDLFVEPGERVIEARLGSTTARQSVRVARGSSQRVALAIDPGLNMKVVIPGAAVGVLGIGSGVVFAILSNGKASDAEAVPQGSPVRADLRDDQTTFGNVSFWSFLGGGVALAGTAVYVLTSGFGAPAPEASTGVHAAPMVVAKGGGLMIGGSF